MHLTVRSTPRVKIASAGRNNVGKIGRMSIAEVSKDPRSYRNVCVISTRSTGFNRVKDIVLV
jgi:hypothetical protein